MLKRTVSEKSVLLKHKKNKEAQTNVKNNRFLITVNVVGSVGPISFVVNEDDLVAGVIDTTLKSYARLGRLPVLGSDVNNFFLYPAAKFETLNPWERIGTHGERNFGLYKKKSESQITKEMSEMIDQKGSGRLKDWVNRSLSFKVLSH
ncbi:uncharacterized protein LOC115975947 [Quercus lobata]|uniref:DUF7054 domain-containing protein n=1 Tax=Quercus lobata TaxID=97700 RepID=A0A7N2KWR2_QUELO|nr:uncharacterized protein LOC115975947 [Quercus lobata]